MIYTIYIYGNITFLLVIEKKYIILKIHDDEDKHERKYAHENVSTAGSAGGLGIGWGDQHAKLREFFWLICLWASGRNILFGAANTTPRPDLPHFSTRLCRPQSKESQK